MKLFASGLASLSLLSLSLGQRTPQWAIDASCDNTADLRSRDGIIAAMAEARNRASISFQVMDQYGDNPRVTAICKMVLGDEDYETKFQTVKDTFRKIATIAENPAQNGIGTDEWNNGRTWDDVVSEIFHSNRRHFIKADSAAPLLEIQQIYCGLDRFSKPPDNPDYLSWLNAAWNNRRSPSVTYDRLKRECYDSELRYGDGKVKMKMGTESSAARVYRVGVPPVPQPHLPYTIDVCWSFTRQFQDRQFPRLNDDLISEVTSVAFREETEVLNEQLRKQGNKQLLSCIDGLKTMGGTLLHELTHTHLGGDTRDLPEGECYSWKCVVAAKSVRNADSFAMLGIALELWSRNYMVNEDGTFEKFE